MKGRLYGIIYLCSLISIMLCACGKDQNLIDMSTAEGDGYMAIIWEGRTYVPFCPVSKNDCGTKIGYLNGETDNRVCEYKDYPTEEWIANYLTVDGGAMLFKETNVTEIPDGLESEYEWNTAKWDRIPMVMVNDVLYMATGYEKENVERRDAFDGGITSEVDGSEQPTVNDQSNFGTGYGYQFSETEGIIEIYINDKWQVFATEEMIASAAFIPESDSGQNDGEKTAISITETAKKYEAISYEAFKERTGNEAEFYHGDRFIGEIPDSSFCVIYIGEYDEDAAGTVLADDAMPIRLQGPLGVLMDGVNEEMSLTEFSEALSADGAAEAVFELLEGGGTAYYIGNEYVQIQFDSDKNGEYDRLLLISLDESIERTVDPESIAWLEIL